MSTRYRSVQLYTAYTPRPVTAAERALSLESQTEHSTLTAHAIYRTYCTHIALPLDCMSTDYSMYVHMRAAGQ